jgi:hypothetical protein
MTFNDHNDKQLFHQIGHEWQHPQVAGAFHGGGHTALVFQAVARDAPREQFPLFVDELQQKVAVFIVNVFNAKFAKAAVFFVAQPDFRVAEKFYVFS